MCTVVLSLQPEDPVPFLLLGVRDEFTSRPWRPPGRHWRGQPLVGGIDEQAGGTWLAVHPGERRVSCLLNGRGAQADQAARRSRGELPLRAAGDGAGTLKELADDPAALAAYDPFHLVCADTAAAMLLSWDGSTATCLDLAPGTHVLTNAGHAYPLPASADTEMARPEPKAGRLSPEGGRLSPEAGGPEPEAGRLSPESGQPDPKAARFGPKFAASRPSGAPTLPLTEAWGEWLTLADGDGVPPGEPEAIVARRVLPDGKEWGSTSQTLVALARDGLRYDFRTVGQGWYQVPV